MHEGKIKREVFEGETIANKEIKALHWEEEGWVEQGRRLDYWIEFKDGSETFRYPLEPRGSSKKMREIEKKYNPGRTIKVEFKGKFGHIIEKQE